MPADDGRDPRAAGLRVMPNTVPGAGRALTRKGPPARTTIVMAGMRGRSPWEGRETCNIDEGAPATARETEREIGKVEPVTGRGSGPPGCP
jgi:hypothetical protein